MPGPLALAAIPAAATLASGLAGSAFNLFQASKNRRFQERMSSTAHQREVSDLLAAGLNPILSATGGHGAATPPGSSAQAAQADVGRSITEGMALHKNMQLIEAQINDINSAAALKKAQRMESISHRQKTDMEWDLLYEQIMSARQERSHSAYDIERLKREFEFEKGPGGRIKPWVKLIPNFGIVPSMGLKIPSSRGGTYRPSKYSKPGKKSSGLRTPPGVPGVDFPGLDEYGF